MNSELRRKNHGFTLMELLVVMVILSVLVALATGTYGTTSRRGRDNRRKNDLRNLATSLEVYYGDKGRYPTSNANGEMVGCGTGDLEVCRWGGEFKDQKNTFYMVLIPDDPVTGQKYYYVGTTNTYKLYARLENTYDQGDGVNQAGYASTDCSDDAAVLCTYGISSGNTKP